MLPPAINQRVAIFSDIGTIRYIGQVAGYSGQWLGVEWDNPTRGKHDGSKDNIRYFACKAGGNPASFIRPSAANLSYGRPFIEALIGKYVDATEDMKGTEKVILGSSAGAIEVEAPRLASVRHRLANIERLRIVSLDGQEVNGQGDDGAIANRSLQIEALDLSRNLLSGWDQVMRILQQLPRLKSLSLNDNRLTFVEEEICQFQGIGKLEELQLNNTSLSVAEVYVLGCVFPLLKHLEIGSCGFESLEWPSKEPAFVRLETLNLASNKISSWASLLRATRALITLQSLILADNAIAEIPWPDKSDLDPSASSLQHLSLIQNQIHAWGSIDAMSAWLPKLRNLSIQETPLVEENAGDARALMIARLPVLSIWNGSSVSLSERRDSELFYLSSVAKSSISGDVRIKDHPRWPVLCSQHGTPEAERPSGPDNLNSRLMELYVQLLTAPPPRDCTAASLTSDKPVATTIKVLPSMTLKTLQIKALKAIKITPGRSTTAVKLYAILHAPPSDSGHPSKHVVVREMDMDADGRKEIDFWLENGSGVGILIE
ncbi:hypothetical protein FRB96_009332 [Tulasnella sp. 330]|nr:hypothetical protein FRB96_009332 [Tulasnella sp. 330]KAG8885244.1 hypothetical protein FRB97_001690 [Tulasnella sp. 331]